ncbi:MAG: hypothetical protein H6Q73_1266 [Firmicutes bacterium]|nr:hypothetical protein [Bacillota bacterium]
MSIFRELCNCALIRELGRELNTDVLLFGFDGFTYFGTLQAIDDSRIAILSPAVEAETSNVEILSPGGELVEVKFARVDLWQIVAKGTGIVTDPIDPPRPPGPAVVLQEASLGTTERQESCDLIRWLARQVGDDVAITTLGGFLFEGTLSELDDCLAILSVDDIFVPGTSSSISSNNLRSVVINLNAITSVSGATS